VRRELGSLALRVVEQDGFVVAVGFGVTVRRRVRRHVELVGLTGMLCREALERRRPVFETFLDRRRVPFAKREDARLHPNERVVLFAFFDESREACAHRDLGALAHVAEQVSLDGYVSYLFVM
jgi:hypothetical protein